MTKQYTYKFRIYPNREQTAFLGGQIGYNRFVYNFFLERAINLYKIHNIKFNYYASKKVIPLLKKGFPFLRLANSQSLQSSLKNLDAAFKNFFCGRAKFPAFKKKNDNYGIAIPQHFVIKDGLLYLPKLESPVKVKFHRKVQETVKSINITKTPSNKYYVNMLVEKEFTPKSKSVKVSGIDLGIKDFAIITSGTAHKNYNSVKVLNPKYLVKSQRRLIKLSRQLSKKRHRKTKTDKTKPSGNYIKFKNRLSKLHEHITNQRKDYLHKASSKTVNDSQVIVLEDLNIKGMVKNKCLSKSISDASWGMFAGMLKYKADWYGRDIVTVDRFYPSSKTCNKCGYIKHDLKLSDRGWICPVCDAVHDRDVNASINLFLKGLIIRQELPELTPAEYAPAGIQSIGYSGHTSKQEASRFMRGSSLNTIDFIA